MHLQQIKSAAHSFAPPKPFSHHRDEADFQAQYIRSGYGFAVAIALVGALASLALVVLSRLNSVDAAQPIELQLFWLAIGVSCGLSFFFLLFDPQRALRNYRLTVFFPAFISLLGLGILVLPQAESATAIASTPSQSTLALVVAMGLISAFCRLPLSNIMFMTLVASALNLAILFIFGEQNFRFFVADLALVNLIAWTLTIQTEKRERLIWHQATRNRTNVRKARNSVRQATIMSDAQARLIRSVGHDIRQPLSSSGIYLGVVTRAAQQSANDVMEQNLARVKTCLRAVEGTLERLLDLPGESDDRNLETYRTDLSQIFQDLRDVFEPQADRLGVDLRFTQACELNPIVRTNERAMREVLSNVVANALKYSAIVSQRSPSVVVGVVCLPDQVRIDVIDNGIGIPAELHTRVFDEYFRAPAVVDKVRGTGLGLAIVESTVQRLPDHRLQLQSRHAQGTRVRIYLPRA